MKNLVCTRPDSKFFQLYGPYTLCPNYSLCCCNNKAAMIAENSCIKPNVAPGIIVPPLFYSGTHLIVWQHGRARRRRFILCPYSLIVVSICNSTFISFLCNLTCTPCFPVGSVSSLIMQTVMLNINCQLNEIYSNHGSKPLGLSVGGLSRLVELRRRYHSIGGGLWHKVTSCLQLLLSWWAISSCCSPRSVFLCLNCSEASNLRGHFPRTSHKTF